MRTGPGKLVWIALVVTVAAAIPLVAYLIFAGGPQCEPITAPAVDGKAVSSPEKGLHDLADQAVLQRDSLQVSLAGELLLKASDIRKDPGTHRATASTLDLYLGTFLAHGGNDLAESMVRMAAALPPGTREIVSPNARLSWLSPPSGAPGPAEPLPLIHSVAASIGVEEDSVRIAGVWHPKAEATADGKPVECSIELTCTIRNGLLFARYDCPPEFGVPIPLNGLSLSLSSALLTGSQFLEVRGLALNDPANGDRLLTVDLAQFKAAAAVDRPLILSMLAADRLSAHSGWTFSLEGIEGDLARLERLPPLAFLAPLPSARLRADALTWSAAGELLAEKLTFTWPERAVLKARTLAGRTDGRRSSFSFVGPEIEEAAFGLTLSAPEILAVRDEFRTWWLTSAGYRLAPPANPIRLASLLNLGEELKSALKGMSKNHSELPPLLVPDGVPDLHLDFTDGTASLPFGKGTGASGINLTFAIRGGMVESAQARVCLGHQCEEADARIAFATDSVGRVQQISLKAAGAGTARRLAPLLPSPVAGLGNLEVDLQASAQGERLLADFKVAFNDLKFFHRKLALEPFTASLVRLEGSASLDLRQELLEVNLAKAQLGQVYARIVGELAGFSSGLPRFELTVDFPEQNCAHLLRSVPKGFAPELEHARLRGTIWFKADFALDLKDVRKSIRIDVDGDLEQCEALSLGPEFDVDALNDPNYVHRVVVNGEDLGVDVGPGTGDYAPLMQVPRVVQAAAYGTEDLAFFEHNGFRIGLIRRALILFLERGFFAYGGSTISQQLVKNLFLTRHKTISRKFQEAVIVWAMERKLTKERIFELYLNCIEYGPKLWGITRASRHYFGKHVSQLNAAEAAFLMGLKPDPGYGYLQFHRGKLNSQWKKQLQQVLKRLLDMGAITNEQYQFYTRTELQFRPRSQPAPDAIPDSGTSSAPDQPPPPDEDKPVPEGQEQGEL